MVRVGFKNNNNFMETLTYTKTYTDTPEHILFGAKFYGYKETITDPNWVSNPDVRELPAQIPNPQTPGDYMIAVVDKIIKDFMTKPIQAYIKQQADIQAQQQAEQASQAVLANLQ